MSELKSELRKKKPSVLLGFLRAAVSLSIVGAAVLIAAWLMYNPAHTQKMAAPEMRKVYVTTEPISFGNYPVEIDVMGKVSPAREMVLKARVSGEIIETSDNFIPGGFFKAGEEILKIDPTDYKLAVKSSRAAFKKAKAAYQIEEGQQQIAKNEIEALQRNTGGTLKSTDLALRKPQLEQAKAGLEAAKAALDKALLNLKRTTLKSPFNAILTQRNTDLGNIVAAQAPLATLVDTGEYWINVDVPLNDVPWLVFYDEKTGTSGTKAIIQLGYMRGQREGEVFKRTGTVNDKSRLMTVIVRVKDPLLLERAGANNPASSLVLDDYVHVKLIGKSLNGVARIEQQYLRKSNGKDVVWLEQGGRLVIQPVTVVYSDREYVYISDGLDYAKNLVTSNIITPVSGMDITVQNNGSQNGMEK